MSESPPTRATLLLRLRDRDDSEAWSEFVRNYGPMLYRFVRSRGLQDADTADLVQEVMKNVGNAIGRLDYEKEKGGFRAWLFTITRNQLNTFFRNKQRQQRDGVTGYDSQQLDLLNQAPDPQNELERQWEFEHQRQLMIRAIEIVRPQLETQTWSAFELTAIKGIPAAETGKQLNMKTGTVYVARSRVSAKLRTEIERLMADDDV